MKRIVMTVFVVLASQLAFGQYIRSYSLLRTRGTQTSSGNRTTARPSLQQQVEQQVTQAITTSNNNPRQITVNGETYRLRRGESFYMGKSQVDGWPRGKVNVRTYTNDHQDTLFVYKMNYMENDGVRDYNDKSVEFTRNISAAHVTTPGRILTAREIVTLGSSAIEACEVRNPDGSCRYIVNKFVYDDPARAQYGLTIKQNIPANANREHVKRNTYQAVRQTDIPGTFGNAFSPLHNGIFGNETYPQ